MADWLGKALTGAAQVAMPAALAKQQADIQRMRDETLNKYQSARDDKMIEADDRRAAEDRTFRTGERVAGQEFTAGENASDRENALSIAKVRARAAADSSGASSLPTDAKMIEYLVDVGLAKNRDDAYNKVRMDKSLSEILSLVSKEMTEQDMAGRIPGREGYQSVEERLDYHLSRLYPGYASKDEGGDGGATPQYTTPQQVRAAFQRDEITREEANRLIGELTKAPG